MFSATSALVLTLCFLDSALLVDAGLYVIQPSASSKCHGGQTCIIQWLDDGIYPLLSAIGVCTVGLFTGEQQLVQGLSPVDVFRNFSMSFTPNPLAGPNSGAYYIGITSISSSVIGNNPYMAFSPFFSIDQMAGSFQSPLASATSTKPLPSSLVYSTESSTPILSTITVGTLSTYPSTPSPLSSSPPSFTSAVSTLPLSSAATLTSPSPAASASSSSTSLSTLTSTPTSSSSTLTPSGTGTVTGSGSISLAPPVSTSSSGALCLAPVPVLGVFSLPLMLPFFVRIFD